MLTNNIAENKAILIKLIKNKRLSKAADLIINAYVLAFEQKDAEFNKALNKTMREIFQSRGDYASYIAGLDLIALLKEIIKNNADLENKIGNCLKELMVYRGYIYSYLVEPNQNFDHAFNLAVTLFGLDEVCQNLSAEFVKSFDMPLQRIINWQGVLKTINSHNKNTIIEKLLYGSLKSQNFFLLQAIYQEYREIYNDIKSKIQSNDERFRIFQAMDAVNLMDDDQYKIFSLGMFTRITSSQNYVNFNLGLLTLAAKYAKNNETDLKPIVIKSDEMDALFKSLASAPRPNRLRFVVEGTHWLSCDAKVDENGLSLFIVNPSGFGKDSQHYERVIDSAKKAFTKRQIYIAQDLKQNSLVDCSAFALDDVMHLYTVEKYLDPKVYPDGLFDFLKKNIIEDVRVRCQLVYVTKQPLHLLRNKQSRALLDEMNAERVGEHVLNKKGVTPRSFAMNRHGFYADPGDPSREQNLRLENKARKMKTRNFDYLLTNTPAAVIDAMTQYSFDGWKKKLMRSIERNPQKRIHR